jgi:hypothetical protein
MFFKFSQKQGFLYSTVAEKPIPINFDLYGKIHSKPDHIFNTGDDTEVCLMYSLLEEYTDILNSILRFQN